MMKINTMKKILFNKFKDENCSFTYKDIKIEKTKKYHDIIIKGYENIVFRLSLENDDFFGYCVYINEIFHENYFDDIHNIIFIDNKENYDIENALIYLGYHIANTF